MSTEAVKKFWEKAQQDKALQAKLTNTQATEGQVALAAVIQLAADAGFAFTAVDYEAAIKEELARQHAAGELSERELADVAGGVFGRGAFLPQTLAQTSPCQGCTAGCSAIKV